MLKGLTQSLNVTALKGSMWETKDVCWTQHW